MIEDLHAKFNPRRITSHLTSRRRRSRYGMDKSYWGAEDQKGRENPVGRHDVQTLLRLCFGLALVEKEKWPRGNIMGKWTWSQTIVATLACLVLYIFWRIQFLWRWQPEQHSNSSISWYEQSYLLAASPDASQYFCHNIVRLANPRKHLRFKPYRLTGLVSTLGINGV
jgi:hypothetical protein